MKCAVLEGSNMAGVNLRVGTIKYANLQNCTLRGAVLAGADLEVKLIISSSQKLLRRSEESRRCLK